MAELSGNTLEQYRKDRVLSRLIAVAMVPFPVRQFF